MLSLPQRWGQPLVLPLCIGERCLETKIRVPGVLIVNGLSMLPGPLSYEIYACTRVYTHVFLSLPLPISIKS